LNWLGWSGLDTVGRLAILTAGTAVLSRCLSPRDFGVAALALTVSTAAGITVGAPFEEALAQRKVLRLVHLRAALSACWLASLAWFVLSVPLGLALSWVYGEREIALLLPASMISIFFVGHSDILSGLVRRQRRFTDLSIATLIGNAGGVALSIGIALAGGGVWALIAQRVLVAALRALALQARIGIPILPTRSLGHLHDLVRYAGVSLVDRLLEDLTYLAFNYVVGGAYGLNTLGHVNMAMRLVEPIRGAIGSTSHNVAFSFYARLQSDRERLGECARMVNSYAAMAIAPVFVGLAAVTPVLLPLVAGSGWEPSIAIAICLAIGSAIILPARLIFTALSARALPEYNLIANIIGFAGTMAVLIFGAKMGAISVGIARIVGDLLPAMVAIGVPPRLLGWTRRGRFLTLARAWSLAAAMGIFVAGFDRVLLGFGRPLQLTLLVSLGIAAYGVFLLLFAPRQISGFAALFAARAKPAEG
jgi:O-antigen/teichoic acid export membrane protein